MATLLKHITGIQLFNKCLKQSLEATAVPYRTRMNPPPRKRHPQWLPKPQHANYKELLTRDNQQFIQEVAAAKYRQINNNIGIEKSPLNAALVEPHPERGENSRRTGLIGKKIGVYPMWMKDGQRVHSTLIQICDNEVVKYIPPDAFDPVVGSRHRQIKTKLGCLVVGAESADPQKLTKEYCGIFNAAGVAPKQHLMRFIISPDAVLQPGTPLYASHFRPGDIVDIRAKTIDRGFQGVMKRWGFHGQPASHGATKTHRRPGNIGTGSQKARVMPGTKLPGHMGNRWRVHRGIRILRVNTKYNVLWILGSNLPGETNSYCYLYDTLLPRRKTASPHFPTYLPGITEESIPEDIFADDVHSFLNPTIEYEQTS